MEKGDEIEVVVEVEVEEEKCKCKYPHTEGYCFAFPCLIGQVISQTLVLDSIRPCFMCNY